MVDKTRWQARYLDAVVPLTSHGSAGARATPWRAIFCNKSVLCLPLAFFAGNYPWYVFLTFLPQARTPGRRRTVICVCMHGEGGGWHATVCSGRQAEG